VRNKFLALSKSLFGAKLMCSHSVHHRGQLSAYLRPMGAKVPGIYGPSGDTDIPESAQTAAH
jgi:uncharacterized damage-inducible protein DinB